MTDEAHWAAQRTLQFACIGWTILAAGSSATWAIVLSQPSEEHVVVPGTAAFGVNLDGVVLLGNQVHDSNSVHDLVLLCSGALITDRHILTAAHCLDRDEDGEHDFPFTVFPFVAGFESAMGSTLIKLKVDTIAFPPSWPDQNLDLAVVELVDDAPPDVPRYLLQGGRDEVGQPVVLAGYGKTGTGATGADDNSASPPIKRTGLNRIDAIRDDDPGVEFLAFDFDSGLAANNALALNGFESDLGFGDDEVFSSSGDSGGPVLIEGRIAGVVSYVARLPEADIDSQQNDSWGEGGFATRVSGFQEFVLAATDGQAVFVPEPSASCLLWSAMFAIWGLGIERRQR